MLGRISAPGGNEHVLLVIDQRQEGPDQATPTEVLVADLFPPGRNVRLYAVVRVGRDHDEPGSARRSLRTAERVTSTPHFSQVMPLKRIFLYFPQ